MLEIVGYILGFSVILIFFYFMWQDTKPLKENK